MNEQTKQALDEGRVAYIQIDVDLTNCTFVPLKGKGTEDGTNNDGHSDRAG